jgi:hypothetical protein
VALTIAIDGKGSIAVANTGTETWARTGTIAAPGSETDIVLQGAQAVSTKASSKAGWMYFDIGAGNELDFSASGTEEDQLLYIWINVTTVGILDTLANKGLAIQVGSTTANFDYWTLMGSDGNGNGYTGGWICAIIDISNVTATGTGGTGLNKASARYFGVYISTTASSKSENLIIDQIMVGNGLRITGSGATDGWQDVVDYCTDFTNRAWGMVQERAGIYYIFGHLYVGDSTQTAVTSLSDNARIFRFGDFQYYTGSVWATSITNGHNGFTVEDAASYTTTFQDGTLVGSDQGRSGSVWIGSDLTNTTFDLYGGSNAASVTKMYGGTLRGIDGGITWGNDSDHHCYSVVFEECAQFAPVGAVKIRNCLFINTVDADAAILWNENIDIQNCQFIANTTGAGVEMPSAVGTPYTYTNLTFSGNTYDVLNSSGSAITISKQGTSDPSTYEGSTVTFEATVTITITVEDIVTTDPISGVRVALWAADGTGIYPYKETVTITRSGSTATVSHTAHGMATGDYVVIDKTVDQVEYSGIHLITKIDANSYSYTVSGAPVTPATGVIKATGAFLSGTTDVNGEIERVRSVGVNTPVEGFCRKSTSSPRYKTFPLAGNTVTSVSGLSAAAPLIRDD